MIHLMRVQTLVIFFLITFYKTSLGAELPPKVAPLTDKILSEECSICFDEMNTSILILKECGHKFHKKCLKNWLRTKNQRISSRELSQRKKITIDCPLCRIDADITGHLESLFSYEGLLLIQIIKDRYKAMNSVLVEKTLESLLSELSPMKKERLYRLLIKELSPQSRNKILDSILLPTFEEKLKKLSREKSRKQQKACCILL